MNKWFIATLTVLTSIDIQLAIGALIGLLLSGDLHSKIDKLKTMTVGLSVTSILSMLHVCWITGLLLSIWMEIKKLWDYGTEQHTPHG